MTLFDECSEAYDELKRDGLCANVMEFSTNYLGTSWMGQWSKCRSKKHVPVINALNLYRILSELNRHWRAERILDAALVQQKADLVARRNKQKVINDNDH